MCSDIQMNTQIKVCPINETKTLRGKKKGGGGGEKKRKGKKKENSLDLQCPWRSDAPNPIP